MTEKSQHLAASLLREDESRHRRCEVLGFSFCPEECHSLLAILGAELHIEGRVPQINRVGSVDNLDSYFFCHKIKGAGECG